MISSMLAFFLIEGVSGREGPAQDSARHGGHGMDARTRAGDAVLAPGLGGCVNCVSSRATHAVGTAARKHARIPTIRRRLEASLVCVSSRATHEPHLALLPT